MTPEARDTFFRVKDLLVNASQLVIMNETDPLILYTDGSTVSIGGVLMQDQIESKKHHLHSHILSDQATRWGIMEHELYAFVYCVKQYLLLISWANYLQ